MDTMTQFGPLGLMGVINPNYVPTYWFLLPLVIAMSCVYSASRHESLRRIATQSLRLTGMILGILFVAMALLLVINTQT